MDHDPEAAALAGFPTEADCRVLASAVRGDYAYVLLDTGTPGHPYPYGVNLRREGEQWYEISSSNGSSWIPTNDEDDDEDDVGLLCYWDEAPEGADLARVRFLDLDHEVVIRNGYFLFVADDVSQEAAGDARAVAFHIGDRWQPPPMRRWPGLG